MFAAILDDGKGGRFEIAPTQEGVNSKQFYWPDTNVLVTRFLSPSGVGEIEDFMPAGLPRDSPWQDHLIRRVKVTRGNMEFLLRCHPAFDYARATHHRQVTEKGASFHSPELALGSSPRSLSRSMIVASGRHSRFRKDKRSFSCFDALNPTDTVGVVPRWTKPTGSLNSRLIFGIAGWRSAHTPAAGVKWSTDRH